MRNGDLYFMDHARTDEQRAHMEELEAAGVCVFCPEHFEEHHREPIEIRGTHWYVTKNDFPYAGTAAHYLLVPYEHVTAFDQLPDEAGAELWRLMRELKQRLQPAAEAIVERSGAMRYNGASVAHLHVHFVALDREPEKTVRFRVSREAEAAWR